ncbi:hypothetical protein BaRGS_00032883 [Batillaria attramentaria]|uniref:Uncharacterized protein n=1 Tax=Batillaria attramentaria TaxID=370345 RepID=A0ABD0JM04_9CAEN
MRNTALNIKRSVCRCPIKAGSKVLFCLLVSGQDRFRYRLVSYLVRSPSVMSPVEPTTFNIKRLVRRNPVEPGSKYFILFFCLLTSGQDAITSAVGQASPRDRLRVTSW